MVIEGLVVPMDMLGFHDLVYKVAAAKFHGGDISGFVMGDQDWNRVKQIVDHWTKELKGKARAARNAVMCQLAKGHVHDDDILSNEARDQLAREGDVNRVDKWNFLTEKGIRRALYSGVLTTDTSRMTATEKMMRENLRKYEDQRDSLRMATEAIKKFSTEALKNYPAEGLRRHFMGVDPGVPGGDIRTVVVRIPSMRIGKTLEMAREVAKHLQGAKRIEFHIGNTIHSLHSDSSPTVWEHFMREVEKAAEAPNVALEPKSNFAPKSGEGVLQEADRITSEDRRKLYGSAVENFTGIAKAFNAATGHNITPAEVGLFNIIQKICREGHCHKRDNMVDIAGYAKLVQQVHDHKDCGDAPPSDIEKP